MMNPFALVSQINVQDGINVQARKFSKVNKLAGWNKGAGYRISKT